MPKQFTRPRRKRRAPEPITQAELQRYVKQVAVCREHQRLANDLRSRLEQGASVENGDLSLAIFIESGRSWSLNAIAEVIGVKQSRELWQSLKLSAVRRLRVKNKDGDIVGWKPRPTVSNTEEVSAANERDGVERSN